MAGRHDQKMSIEEEFLTCGICMELFTRPKILPCVHTFCSDCLKCYILSGAGVASRKKAGFPCPTCREHVPIAKPTSPLDTWTDQLKDNFVMSNMLESLSQRRSVVTPSAPSSDLRHDLRDEGTVCTCDVRKVTVCWVCDVFLCSFCSAKHAACEEVETVEEAGPKRRQEMLDWLPAMRDLSSRLHATMATAQSSVHTLLSRRDVTQDHVTKAANKAMDMVRLQENQLKLQLEASYAPCIRRQQQRKETASKDLEAMTSVREALQQAVAEDDVDLLRQTPSLTICFHDVMKKVGERVGEGRREEEEDDLVTFTPAAFSSLSTAELVGVLKHTSDQQITAELVTSPPLSPSATQAAAPNATSSSVTSSETGSSNKISPSRASSASDTATTSVQSSGVTSSFLLMEGPMLHLSPSPSSPPSSSSSIPLTTQTSNPAQTTSSAAACERTTDAFSLSSPELLSGQRKVTYQVALTFSARVRGDKTNPLIVGLVVTANGWIVATDAANCCIKTFYNEDSKYHCKKLALTQAPYGVTKTEGCVVAITVPKDRQILLIAVRCNLIPLATLSLPSGLLDSPWAVTALSPQRLALSICPQEQGGSVVIVQLREDGVEVEGRYSSPVKTPHCMTASGHSLVIADPTECHVACVTATDGRPVFDRHTNGKSTGVASHARTLLLVDQSPALTLLTNEGRCLHTLPLPIAGKTSCCKPRALAVASDNTIFVSDDSGKILRLELCWQQS